MTSSPRESKRKRRLFWRIFEAVVVLAGLLVAHQTVWLLFDPYLINQTKDYLTGQRGSPDLTVYFKPNEPLTQLSGSNQLFTATYSVKDPYVRLIGFAPPRQVVIPQVNDLDQGQAYTGSGKFNFSVGPLRRGDNRVKARLREVQTEDAAERLSAASNIFVFKPPPLPPRYLAVVLRDGDYADAQGLGEPRSTVFVAAPGGEPFDVTTNEIGAFSQRFTIKPGEKGELRVAMTREELEKTPSDKVTVSRSADGQLVIDPELTFPRKILISFLDDSQYQIDLKMTLPRNAAVHEWVEKKQVSSAELALYVFNLMCSPRENCPFTYQPNAPTVTEEGIQVALSSAIPDDGFQMAITHSGLPILGLSGDEIKLEIGEATRVQLGPDWVRADDKTWIWPKGSPEFASFLTVRPMAKNLTENQVVSAPTARKLENLGDFLRELERKVPEGLNRILGALLTAIPYLYLAWLLRSARSGYQVTLKAVTIALLLFHLTILSLPVFSSSLQVIRDLLGLFPQEKFEFFDEEIDRYLLDSSLDQVGHIYPFLAIGISLLLLPIYRSYKRRPPVITPRRRFVWSYLLRVLLWFAVLTVPLGLFGCLIYAGLPPSRSNYLPPGTNPGTDPEEWLFLAGIVVLASFLLLWFFLYWLIRVSLGRAVRPWSVIKASWAMLLLPLVPPLLEALALAARYSTITKLEIYPFFIPRHLDQLLWLLIIPIIGSLILFQVGYLTIRLSLHRPLLRFFRRRRSKWLLLPVFILFSLPMEYLLGLRQGGVGIWDLTSLSYRIDDLLPNVLLLGLLVYLRQLNPTDKFDLPPEAQRVGVLLFAFYLTGRTANLLFVPIPFLLGWFIFSRWVLTNQSQALSADSTKSELQTLVRRLLDYRQARNLTHDVRRNAEKKYSLGEIDLEQLKTRIAETDKHFDDVQKKLPLKIPGSKNVIFGRGPESGPWANAMMAVRYGLVLSIPFQASTLTKIFAGSRFGNFPLLSILEDVLFSASYWILAAFLFGYFFHLIRGRDGFGKALVYSVALIIPTIPLRIIQAQPLLGQGYVIQMVQIFAFTLVLALVAFDLRSLLKLGYTWRDLLSVHGFTTIMGYVSSIALTTIASVSGKDILRGIWNFIGSNSGRP